VCCSKARYDHVTYVVNAALLALTADAELVSAHVRALPPELLGLDIGAFRVVVEHHVAIDLYTPGRSDCVCLAMDTVEIEVCRSKAKESDQNGQKVHHCGCDGVEAMGREVLYTGGVTR
jgi:hypothetical protein